MLFFVFLSCIRAMVIVQGAKKNLLLSGEQYIVGSPFSFVFPGV